MIALISIYFKSETWELPLELPVKVCKQKNRLLLDTRYWVL